VLVLTYNRGVDSYDLGTGYNHIALGVEDLDGTLERLAADGIEPEKPPYRPAGPHKNDLTPASESPHGGRAQS
jgi:catechol 2,3-dioxygenase-like lactoylglutathione lyase family enzyme